MAISEPNVYRKRSLAYLIRWLNHPDCTENIFFSRQENCPLSSMRGIRLLWEKTNYRWLDLFLTGSLLLFVVIEGYKMDTRLKYF